MTDLANLREAVYARRPGESVWTAELPSGFESTIAGTPSWIAHPGSTGQLRGPQAMHAYEVPGGYEVHRDRSDPRTDPAGHFFRDAPELPIATISAGLAALGAYLALERWDAKKTEEDGRERPAWVRGLIAAGVAIAVWIAFYIIGALVRVGLGAI